MQKNNNWLITVLFVLPAALSAQSTGGVVAGWFDSEEFIINNAGQQHFSKGFDILQYDSGNYWLDSAGAVKPFNTFSAGHSFDLYDDLWSAVPSDPDAPIMSLFHNCGFYWDSIRLNHFYLRVNTDTTTVDTLFIYYYCNFYRSDTQLAATTYPLTYPDTIKAGYPRFFNRIELAGTRYFKKDTLLLTVKDTASINRGGYFTRAVGQSYSGSFTYTNYGMFG